MRGSVLPRLRHHGDWLPRAELIVTGLALLPLALAFFRRPGRGGG